MYSTPKNAVPNYVCTYNKIDIGVGVDYIYDYDCLS